MELVTFANPDDAQDRLFALTVICHAFADELEWSVLHLNARFNPLPAIDEGIVQVLAAMGATHDENPIEQLVAMWVFN